MNDLWIPAPAPDDSYALTICSCEGGPHLGAQKAGTPCCCLACGFITAEQYADICARALRDAAAVLIIEVHAEAHRVHCETQYRSDKTGAHYVLEVVEKWLNDRADGALGYL